MKSVSAFCILSSISSVAKTRIFSSSPSSTHMKLRPSVVSSRSLPSSNFVVYVDWEAELLSGGGRVQTWRLKRMEHWRRPLVSLQKSCIHKSGVASSITWCVSRLIRRNWTSDSDRWLCSLTAQRLSPTVLQRPLHPLCIHVRCVTTWRRTLRRYRYPSCKTCTISQQKNSYPSKREASQVKEKEKQCCEKMIKTKDETNC